LAAWQIVWVANFLKLQLQAASVRLFIKGGMDGMDAAGTA